MTTFRNPHERIEKLMQRLEEADALLKDQYDAMDAAYAEYGPFDPKAELYFHKLTKYFATQGDFKS
jgi:hypothetical protein